MRHIANHLWMASSLT